MTTDDIELRAELSRLVTAKYKELLPEETYIRRAELTDSVELVALDLLAEIRALKAERAQKREGA